MKKMTRNYENPLVRRSKEIIAKAFFERLQENPYKKIRISDICKRAGVSRTTFYTHYDVVEDIPYYYFEDWVIGLEEIIDDLLAKEATPEQVSFASSEWALRYWRDHVDEFKNLQTAGMESALLKLFYKATVLFIDKFKNQYGTFSNPVILDCLYSHGSVSLLSSLKIWINTGIEFSVEEMAKIISILHPVNTYELLYQEIEKK